MWIHIDTELSLPWDDSSDSFYSGSNSDTIADINYPHPIEPQLPPPPEDSSINNPYHHPDPAPPCQTLLQTLRSWIVPQPQNPIPPSLANPTIPVTIEIVNPSQPSASIPPQHYQTALVTSTENNHWGDPMITPNHSTPLESSPGTWTHYPPNKTIFNGEQPHRQFPIAKPTP